MLEPSADEMAAARPQTTLPVPAGPPVFVLCCSRSGSTLLRFFFDAHPDFACPPETSIAPLCAQLVTAWSLIEGSPVPHDHGTEPPVIAESPLARVRNYVDLMMGTYLARRGGQRFCDKSLDTARYADLLLQLYPDARFICLHRHPMDVIASGIEACPWGFTGYGFDPYIAASPGNSLLGLARYWVDNTNAILSVEDRFPNECYRVRYEDLVADPENVSAGIFKFLGVTPAPGISEFSFTSGQERSGPGDYKIWHTDRVMQNSVGRGWTLPVTMIPSPVLDQVNDAAATLGYKQVDGQWGTTAASGDLRVGDDEGLVPVRYTPGVVGLAEQGADYTAVDLINQRIGALKGSVSERLAAQWGDQASVSFGLIVSSSANGRQQARWRINLATASAVRTEDDDSGTDWDVLGSAAAWKAVLCSEVNLAVALRRHDLRYCDTGDSEIPPDADARIGMLADFLRLVPVAR